MTVNLRSSDQVAIVGAINPDATAAGTYTTGWVAVKHHEQLLGVVMAGALGANATVDAKLQQATDGAGAGAKDVTGKTITQLTQAGTDKSNKQALINLFSPDQIDKANNFSHVRLSMTVAVATSDAGAVLLGLSPGYGRASDNDAASVDQIVA